jgi:hypothetical protein
LVAHFLIFYLLFVVLEIVYFDLFDLPFAGKDNSARW